MKNILLNHDSEIFVYSVPDIVADNLEKYCSEFNKWLWESPDAEEYRILNDDDSGRYVYVAYGAEDFIKYLNTWVFPNTPSQLVETLDYNDYFGWIGDVISILPEQYKHCAWYSF